MRHHEQPSGRTISMEYFPPFDDQLVAQLHEAGWMLKNDNLSTFYLEWCGIVDSVPMGRNREPMGREAPGKHVNLPGRPRVTAHILN